MTWWCSTRCCPRPTARRGRPGRGTTGSSKAMSGTADCCAPCCPMWTRCATRRRWSGMGWTSPTCPLTWGTTTRAPRCCSPPCTPGRCPLWCWPVRWWSTAKAPIPAPSTDRCARGRGCPPISMRAATTLPARGAVRRCARSWSARTHRSSRVPPTPPPNSLRSISPRRGPARPVARCGRCATTTSTARGCRATPRMRAWPRSSVRRLSEASHRPCWRTGHSGGTSCTSAMWHGPTSWPWQCPNPASAR